MYCFDFEVFRNLIKKIVKGNTKASHIAAQLGLLNNPAAPEPLARGF